MARILKGITFAFLGIGSLILIFINYKNFSEKKITVSSEIKNIIKKTIKFDELKLKGEENFIKIMFLGIPGKGNPAPNLTDTIILALIKKINENDFSLKLISIPRDFIVYDKNLDDFIKINAFYSLYKDSGIETLREKLYEITGIYPDYYVLVDTSIVKDIVDFLGGVNVFIDQTIDDPFFPANNYGFEHFKIKRGWRYLNGDDAIKFIRTRHSKGGDFDRMKRQHILLLAIYRKLQNKEFKDPKLIYDLWKELKDKIKTNISLAEALKFYSVFEKLKNDNISNIYLNLNNALNEDHIKIYGGTQYVLYPKKGLQNYDEIKLLIEKWTKL